MVRWLMQMQFKGRDDVQDAPLVIDVTNYLEAEKEIAAALGTQRKIYVNLDGGNADEKVDISLLMRHTIKNKINNAESNNRPRIRRRIMEQLQVKDGAREGAALAYKALMLGRCNTKKADEMFAK